ncbi:ATP-binding protein [Steroidobacter flavus]|uniref:ATP-binding protein n=1 Tax=Steroidobacter flavus TaxID=1842136 RepID=A0ABV8T599_9GAMM
MTRKLQREGVTITLGDRALDILIVLVEHAGEIVSHRDLIARVWRDLVVTPGNLRVHMTALRKALGDGEDGVRYIANVAGQGYTFVAPVHRAGMTTAIQPASPVIPATRALPPALTRMVGRDDAVRTIAADLRTDRFVTIVGPGGMGKTTVAVSVAHAMLDEFAGNVCFVDLGAIADPKLLAATIASTLGLSIQSADPTVALMTFLRTARMLLLLDNCEHVIDDVAPLAEMIFGQAPGVHILATSREALRVEGEHAHWLRPLESPPPDSAVSAAKALTFPAVKLFVERATASDSRFAITDANAPIVVDICGRLDGIALALEFVAGRIGTYGLEGTATLLDKRLGLHWQGRRTALPRHQTLQALLDWSYSLLSPSEQHVLRRLSIFVGTFTLEAAHAVASDAALEGQFISEVDQLIAKSLVSVIPTPEGSACYRLLETTRIYALRKLEESAGEADATAERHARYFTQLLNPTAGGDCRRTRHEDLGNLRAALQWCFAGSDDSHKIEPGIDLAAASVASFLDLSLWNECRKWSEAALAAMPEATRGNRRELVLQEALAISSLLTNAIEARTAIDRGLEIARQLGETAIRFRLLGALHVYVLRMTDFKSSLTVAEEMDAVARETNDVNRRVIADWMLGSSQYVLGNPAVSKQLFESGFSHGIRATESDQQLAGLYYRTRALYGLARVQWLCGFPDQALQSARQSMVEAAESGSPVNVSYSLVYSCYVFLWCGDLDTAQEMNEQVMALPHWQGRLVWFHAEAFALKGELLVRRGHLQEGIELLRTTLADMQASSQKNLMLSVTACCLAEALATIGRPEEALSVINDAIAHAPGGAETWDAPELFRIKAIVLLAMPTPDETRAENCLMQSLALARHQGAKGWELRTTITLARLRATQGRAGEARDMLSKLYDQFTEGLQTQDLKAAAELLTSL